MARSLSGHDVDRPTAVDLVAEFLVVVAAAAAAAKPAKAAAGLRGESVVTVSHRLY